MRQIIFHAAFGDAQKAVKITSPSGGDGYDILIDNYFQGTIFKRNGKWVGYPNERSVLNGDDIVIIGEIIDGTESAP